MVFGEQQRFFERCCLATLVSEGRKEPVTGLQRHPLIDPIFPQPPFSVREAEVSAPFARGNLHLVISLR